MNLAKALKRKVAFVALLFSPVVAGLLYMTAYGAPEAYIVGNSVAGLVVTVGILCLPSARNFQMPTIISTIVACVVLALIATSLAGPSLDGARRWIKLGTFSLHAGMLLLPSLIVILPGLNARLVCGVTLCTAALFAIQPDFASALALCISSFVIFFFTRDRSVLLGFFGASVALGFTIVQKALIAPVPFVEAVLQDAAPRNPIISIGMILSIAMAVSAPIYALSKKKTVMPARNWALSACLFGYFLASLTGDFPTPLLGYGVSPIFGFGFACMLMILMENCARQRSTSL